MVPLQANMASLRTVLPEDACPTMAKLRIFAEGCVAIAPRMKLKWLVCNPRETKECEIGCELRYLTELQYLTELRYLTCPLFFQSHGGAFDRAHAEVRNQRIVLVLVPTSQGLRRGQSLGVSSHLARARQSVATAASCSCSNEPENCGTR